MLAKTYLAIVAFFALLLGLIHGVEATETPKLVPMIRGVSQTQGKVSEAQILAVERWLARPFSSQTERAAFFGDSLSMPSFRHGNPYVPVDPYLRYCDIENLVDALLRQAEMSARHSDWNRMQRFLLLAVETAQETTSKEFTPPRQVLDGTTSLKRRDTHPDDWLKAILVAHAAVPAIGDTVDRLIAMKSPGGTCLRRVDRLVKALRRNQKQSARDQLRYIRANLHAKFINSVRAEMKLDSAALNNIRSILQSRTFGTNKPAQRRFHDPV